MGDKRQTQKKWEAQKDKSWETRMQGSKIKGHKEGWKEMERDESKVGK